MCHTLSIKALEVDNYDRINYNGSKRIISFNLVNKWPTNLSITWNITGYNFTNTTYLRQNKSIMVIIENNFSQGRQEPSIKAYSTNFSNSLLDRFWVHILQLLDYQILNEGGTSAGSELLIRNDEGYKNISWQLDTGDGIINSNISLTLNETETVMVIIENSYSTDAVYKTNASINSSTYTESQTGVAIIS